MKKLLIILLLLLVLLFGCTIEGPPLEEEVEETPEVEPVEPEVEEPEVEEPEVEEEEPEEEEEPVEEEPEEVVEEEELPEGWYKVAEGDTITHDEKSILVEDINNYGSEVYLKESVNRIKLSGTRSPEIVAGLEYEIVKNTFNKDTKVTVSVKTPVYGEDEYLVQKKGKVTVGNITVALDTVKSDKYVTAAAFVSRPVVSGSSKRVKLGETIDFYGLEVTLVRAFYKTYEYAVLKIVPK